MFLLRFLFQNNKQRFLGYLVLVVVVVGDVVVVDVVVVVFL